MPKSTKLKMRLVTM